MDKYNTEKEVWKDIKGFEGLYKVSDKGNVWSCRQKKEMKQRINKGYNVIKLTKDGKQTTETVSRLVASTFLNNPKNKNQVNHIDENRRNNSLYNLEWVTSKENCNHGTRMARISATFKERGISKAKRVAMLDKETGAYLAEFQTIRDAYEHLGKKVNGNISRVCVGKKKSIYGYKWKYI